jgi:hypothetical protein
MNTLNELCAELDLAVLTDVVGDVTSPAAQHCLRGGLRA